MKAYTIARVLSAILNPYIHPVHVFAYLYVLGRIYLWEALIGVLLYSFIPLAVHLIVVNLTGEPHNVPYREHRVPILISALLSYIVTHLLFVSPDAKLLALIYIASGIALLALLVLARVSAHVMGFVPPITMYAYIGAIPLAIVFTFLMLSTAWARAKLEVHSALEISLALAAGFTASTTVLLVH